MVWTGYDVELRVGFSLEVGGVIHVNLALLCPDCAIKAFFCPIKIYKIHWAVQLFTIKRDLMQLSVHLPKTIQKSYCGHWMMLFILCCTLVMLISSC